MKRDLDLVRAVLLNLAGEKKSLEKWTPLEIQHHLLLVGEYEKSLNSYFEFRQNALALENEENWQKVLEVSEKISLPFESVVMLMKQMEKKEKAMRLNT